MPSLFQTLAAPLAPKPASLTNLTPASNRATADSRPPRAGGFQELLGKSLDKSSPKTSREELGRADRSQPSRANKSESKKTSTRARKADGKKDDENQDETEPTEKSARKAESTDIPPGNNEEDVTDAQADSHLKTEAKEETVDPAQAAQAAAGAQPANTAAAETDTTSEEGTDSETSEAGVKAPVAKKAVVREIKPGQTTAADEEQSVEAVDAKEGQDGKSNGAIPVPVETQEESSIDDPDGDIQPIKIGGGLQRNGGPLFGGPATPPQNAAVSNGAGATDTTAVAKGEAAAVPAVGVTTPAAVEEDLDVTANLAPRKSELDSDRPAQVPFGNTETVSTKSDSPVKVSTPPVPPAPEQPPEAKFAEANHASILTGIRGELLPNGGSMQLRLDPPALGDLVISVQMRDGVMTASFQTSNEEATRMLSHSLAGLKGMLEAQGVTVEKLQVQQAPKQEQGQNQQHDSNQRQPTWEEQQNARREQQRKDMVQKMWDKLTGRAPVDLTA